MTASILFDQATRPAATAGKSRSDLVVGQLATCSNSSVASSYLWTLLDIPIRSALVRGTTGTGSTFTFTPDVKGTYLVSVKTNGSDSPSENNTVFGSVLSTSRAWRYLAAKETNVDNQTYSGLGFPSNINARGWSTVMDLILEDIEAMVTYPTSTSISNLASYNLLTTDRMVIMSGAGATAVHLATLTDIPMSGKAVVIRIVNNGTPTSIAIKDPASATIYTVPGYSGAYVDVETTEGNSYVVLTPSLASTNWFGSDARGDVGVRGSTKWGRLALGAAGTVLTSNGTDLIYSPNIVTARTVSGNTDTLLTTDCIVSYSNAGTVAVSLPALGAPPTGTWWVLMVQQTDAATAVTVTPATSIDGAGTLALVAGIGSASLRSPDGSIWYSK